MATPEIEWDVELKEIMENHVIENSGGHKVSTSI